jgi:hypothetical protein
MCVAGQIFLIDFAHTAPGLPLLGDAVWLEMSLLRDVFAMCPNVRWVHSRAAGLDTVLFPELTDSPVPLTNGSGVFSQSLGEFAVGAILYFAKDFRRMIRNQAAGVWEPFDIVEVTGQTVGIVGYGDIGRAVQETVERAGFSVVTDFAGHGIGRRLHEDPQVPNYFRAGMPNQRLREGMALAIEPMVNEGSPDLEILSDGWTAVTADGKLSAHFEHSIAITSNGPEILSELENV